MKCFNLILIASVLFGIFQCKKDKEVINENILPNGDYGFGYTDQYDGQAYFRYKIIDNNFYIRIGDTICMDRIAGTVFRDGNGEIKLTKLDIQGLTMVYPCVFRNDYFGGDTSIVTFSNIFTYIDYSADPKGIIALKGDCSILMPSIIPFPKIFGPFVLSYSRVQNPK